MLFESGLLFQILRTLVIIIGTLGMIASITVFKPALNVPLSQHVFTASTQLIIAAYITTTVTLINVRGGTRPLTNILSLFLAFFAFILLDAVFLRRIHTRKAATIKQGWGLLSVIPCALLVLVISFAHFPKHYTESPSGTFLLYSLGAAIIVIYCAIFCFLKVRNDLSIQERNREILDLQIQNIRKNTADSKRKAEIAKKARQDSFILLSGIADLAKKGNWDAIHEAVNKESTKNDPAVSEGYCSDPILNATLDSYIGRAKNSGITVETNINLPKILPDFSTEFSICLANALENAIKACEKLPKNERKIIVRCTGAPKLMFEVKNTYKEKITFSRDGVPLSSATGHGIGTRSIIAFCEKHDALYSFKAEDGWFQVTVAL